MGILYAIMAAICNSTIGIFTTFVFETNMTPSSISFYRCLVALILTTVIILLSRNGLAKLLIVKSQLIGIALASFFGIFTLYTFEILAISYSTISLVSFLIYSCGIFTLILGVFILNEKITLLKGVSTFFVIIGLSIMIIIESEIELSFLGSVLAITAGMGYSLFLIFIKKYEIPSGLPTLWWIFMFGTVYLFLPFVMQTPQLPNKSNILFIICLAIIPTLGGFFFTNRSLELLEAGKVQLYEMSEPIFATALAFLIFNQQLQMQSYVGILFVLFGLLILGYRFTKNKTFLEKKFGDRPR